MCLHEVGALEELARRIGSDGLESGQESELLADRIGRHLRRAEVARESLEPVDRKCFSGHGLAVTDSPGKERGVGAERAHVGRVVVAVDGVPGHRQALALHRIAHCSREHAGHGGESQWAEGISRRILGVVGVRRLRPHLRPFVGAGRTAVGQHFLAIEDVDVPTGLQLRQVVSAVTRAERTREWGACHRAGLRRRHAVHHGGQDVHRQSVLCPAGIGEEVGGDALNGIHARGRLRVDHLDIRQVGEVVEGAS